MQRFVCISQTLLISAVCVLLCLGTCELNKHCIKFEDEFWLYIANMINSELKVLFNHFTNRKTKQECGLSLRKQYWEKWRCGFLPQHKGSYLCELDVILILIHFERRETDQFIKADIYIYKNEEKKQVKKLEKKRCKS